MSEAYPLEKINNIFNWKDFFETFESKYLSEGSIISHYCLNHPEKTLGEVQELFSELADCFADARLELTKIARDFAMFIFSATSDNKRYYKLSPELSSMREKITRIFYAMDSLGDPEIVSKYYNNFCAFLVNHDFGQGGNIEEVTFWPPDRKYVDPDRGIIAREMSICFGVPKEVIKKISDTPSNNPTQK